MDKIITFFSSIVADLEVALKIMGIGMGIVFAILIVLYLSIKILGRFAK